MHVDVSFICNYWYGIGCLEEQCMVGYSHRGNGGKVGYKRLDCIIVRRTGLKTVF